MIELLLISLGVGFFAGVFLVGVYADVGVVNLSLVGRVITLLMWIAVLPLAIFCEVVGMALRFIMTGELGFFVTNLIKEAIQDLFRTSKTITVTIERGE